MTAVSWTRKPVSSRHGRRNVDSTEFRALPACNPTGNVELIQAGLRYWVVSGRLQVDAVDATYGDRLGNGRGEHWFSVGLRVLTPAFLP
ncbi:MAG TPA: hypothetical protein VGP15_18310 [Burkholderiales bacterium]|nr:hypothetical protein [Burkholderiales bacterium]